MARNIDLSALRSFIAVAETGGVTKAARRLHITQSGVSMQLKRLEESLDVQLLSRDGRGVALTKFGEELLAQGRKLISLNDEIWEKMTSTPKEGALTFGIPHDIVYPLAPRVLRSFAKDFPGVRVALTSPPSSELLSQFEEGEIDVIMTTESGVRRGGETLARIPLVWMGAPGGRAWRRRPVPFASDPRCAFRKPSLEALEKTGVGWDWAIAPANDYATYASVAADLAICSLLKGTGSFGLEEVPHEGELPKLPMFNINLYVNSDHNDALSERLAAYIRHELDNGGLSEDAASPRDLRTSA